jgi:GNAT superfamily N-acetyltransferase
MTQPLLTKEFDPDLWKSGVEDGAFAGDRDPDSVWYTLKVDKDKVAMASAVPGPGDLTTISYFVHPDHREKGYGTKIASRVTDLHEKATFTIFRDNEASIKVAIAALKDKFALTMGHNVVRLTKEAGEKKAVDPLLLGAFGAAGVLGGVLGSKLGARIRAMLQKRKLAVPKEAVHLMDPEDIEVLKEKLEVNVKISREMLKQAVSERYIRGGILSRTLASPVGGLRARGKVSRQSQQRAIGTAAEQVRKSSPAELGRGSEARQYLRQQVRGVQKLFPKSENVPHRQSVGRQLGRTIKAQSPQEQLF